ncbi:unnamed protein product [Prorocentrum cordatum]|uniref:Uncharacterized protein n=1 Tax=Prorocentrum cordatum TaxID=2364126 RepID=A0ABN9XDB4_9DINO|nr:unnamed protein product [Polarella glacialis]
MARSKYGGAGATRGFAEGAPIVGAPPPTGNGTPVQAKSARPDVAALRSGAAARDRTILKARREAAGASALFEKVREDAFLGRTSRPISFPASAAAAEIARAIGDDARLSPRPPAAQSKPDWGVEIRPVADGARAGIAEATMPGGEFVVDGVNRAIAACRAFFGGHGVAEGGRWRRVQANSARPRPRVRSVERLLGGRPSVGLAAFRAPVRSIGVRPWAGPSRRLPWARRAAPAADPAGRHVDDYFAPDAVELAAHCMGVFARLARAILGPGSISSGKLEWGNELWVGAIVRAVESGKCEPGAASILAGGPLSAAACVGRVAQRLAKRSLSRARPAARGRGETRGEVSDATVFDNLLCACGLRRQPLAFYVGLVAYFKCRMFHWKHLADVKADFSQGARLGRRRRIICAQRCAPAARAAILRRAREREVRSRPSSSMLSRAQTNWPRPVSALDGAAVMGAFERWRFAARARLDAAFGSCPLSAQCWASAVRRWRRFSKRALGRGPPPPIGAESLQIAGALFRVSGTFADYCERWRAASEPSLSSTAAFGDRSAQRARLGIAKRRLAYPRVKHFMQHALFSRVVEAGIWGPVAASVRRGVAMLMCFGFAFLLRLPCEGWPAVFDGSALNEQRRASARLSEEALRFVLAAAAAAHEFRTTCYNSAQVVAPH